MHLSSLEAGTQWADMTTNAFRDMANPERTTVVLPLAGFADWGLGRPLDLEENLLGAVVREAVCGITSRTSILVLPPLRFLHAPYAHAFFGQEPDDVEDQILEVARSVQASGFERLVLFNASPWNEALVDGLALDLRVSSGMQTICIHLASLGLDLHPGRSQNRADLQCAASVIHGVKAAEPDRHGQESMTWFRPGRFDQPSAVQIQRTWEEAVARGQSVLRTAGEQLASLLREVSRHPNPVEPEESEQDPAGNNPFPVHPAYPAYRSRYLPALTRPAIENLPGKQAAVVVIPVGAIEQHGPHLPVGTDTVLGHAWLQTALTRIPARVPVYVGPTLSIGKSIEHQGFPGTVSITGRLLRHNLLAIARQLKDWGFHTVAVLNTHGGNSASIEVVLREIQTGLGMTAGMLRPSLARSDSEQENTFGIHAGEVETSLMLAIAPDQVRMDLAECEYPARLNDPGGLRPVKGKATFAWTARDISKTGIMGDAKVATPEKGRAWLEQGGQELAEDLVRLSGQIAN